MDSIKLAGTIELTGKELEKLKDELKDELIEELSSKGLTTNQLFELASGTNFVQFFDFCKSMVNDYVGRYNAGVLNPNDGGTIGMSVYKKIEAMCKIANL